MQKNYMIKLGLFISIGVLCSEQILRAVTSPIQFTSAQLQAIGNKIWHNECKNDIEKLTWWNNGESFASLGIGHFIWYPKDQKVNFTETFPDLLAFLEKKNKKLPAWLAKKSDRHCPWKTKKDFFKDFNSKRMVELRSFLASTIDLQTQFITQRMTHALDSILKTIPSGQKAKIKNQFYRLAGSPAGLFAIIDYINFKGEGINIKERYDGNGWGLLQVLQQMQGTQTGIEAVKEFATHAKLVLTQRVKNAPKDFPEGRFLAGWKKRIDGYIQELKIV